MGLISVDNRKRLLREKCNSCEEKSWVLKKGRHYILLSMFTISCVIAMQKELECVSYSSKLNAISSYDRRWTLTIDVQFLCALLCNLVLLTSGAMLLH
jgi:hypothetical protein